MKRVWATLIAVFLTGSAMVAVPTINATASPEPSVLGQDGQIWNASSSLQMGVIKKWPGRTNYDAKLPPGRWSSSYPLYIGDVDGYYIGRGYQAATYWCEASDCVNPQPSWRFGGYVGEGKHEVPWGFSRTKVIQYSIYGKAPSKDYYTATKANAVPASFTKPAYPPPPGYAQLTNYGKQTFGVKWTSARYDLLLDPGNWVSVRPTSYVVTGPVAGGWCVGFRTGPTGSAWRWNSTSSGVWTNIGPFTVGEDIYVWVIHRYGGTCAAAVTRATALTA